LPNGEIKSDSKETLSPSNEEAKENDNIIIKKESLDRVTDHKKESDIQIQKPSKRKVVVVSSVKMTSNRE